MKKVNYKLAKVNIIENIFTDDENIDKIILEEIPNQIFSYTDFNKYYEEKITIHNEKSVIQWSFTDLKRINENCIKGNLAKIFPLKVTTEVDKKTSSKEFDDIYETLTVSFYYFINEEIIAYRNHNNISSKKFKTIFKELLKLGDSSVLIGEVDIITVSNSESLKQVLFSKTSQIKSIQLTILRPNRPKNTAEEIDKLMKEMKSNVTSLKFESEDDSLNADNDLVHETLNRTESGRAKLTAFVKTIYGSYQKFSSSSSPQQAHVPEEIEDENSISDTIYSQIPKD